MSGWIGDGGWDGGREGKKSGGRERAREWQEAPGEVGDDYSSLGN